MLKNPPLEKIKKLALEDKVTKENKFPTRTKQGSSCYISNVRSRSAKFTRSKVDNEWLESDYKLVEEAKKYLENKELIAVERVMGEREHYQRICRLVVTKEYARIAHGWSELMIFVDEPIAEPDFITYMIPEWPERAILVDGEAGITYALGTDYTGEAKKAFSGRICTRLKKKVVWVYMPAANWFISKMRMGRCRRWGSYTLVFRQLVNPL